MLSEYLNRIQYTGSLIPSLEVLQTLQKAHLMHVPFENLDIHYGYPIELDIHKIYDKIALNERGGFCYELNSLFHHLLITLGFLAKRISARVFDKENGYGLEFDHMALIVTIDETEYLSDVGFGEFTFAPLELAFNKIQQDERGEYIIHQIDDNYLRVGEMVKGSLVPEYIFQNIARDLSDYNEMCYFHQSSPNSHFTKKKLISLPTEGGRITIAGNNLKIKEGARIKESLLKNEKAFEKALWKFFKIKMEQKPSSKHTE